MKEVVSVSLGSAERNKRVCIRIAGTLCHIVRIGTDGGVKRAENWIKRLDGRVDAIGLGGIDRYLTVGNRRYSFRQAELLASCAMRSPIADGSRLKGTLERTAVLRLQEYLGTLSGKKVLLMSAADRYGMAETFEACGAKIVCGDLLFGLGIPIALNDLSWLRCIAPLLAPIAVRLPIGKLYPIGKQQSERRPCYTKYFADADIIAGDYHYIHRYMPNRLDDKIIVTNTTTEKDRAYLQSTGAKLLVTTTPIICGRSFGTNVLEALIMALAQTSEIENWEDWVKNLQIEPTLILLQ